MGLRACGEGAGFTHVSVFLQCGFRIGLPTVMILNLSCNVEAVSHSAGEVQAHRRVQGIDLKGTQAYPPKFGAAWARVVAEFDAEMTRTGERLQDYAMAAYTGARRLTQATHPSEQWTDAHLDGVFKLLSGPLP